jgi:hypothetical protein
MSRGAQIFPKNQERFQILGASKVPWNKRHIVGPQILGATVKNCSRPGFVLFFKFLDCI